MAVALPSDHERSLFVSEVPSPLMPPTEVRAIYPGSAVTMWRAEKLGLFPRRVKIAKRKTAYRRAEIEAWAADPEKWARENSAPANA